MTIEQMTRAIKDLDRTLSKLVRAIERSNDLELARIKDYRALHGGATEEKG